MTWRKFRNFGYIPLNVLPHSQCSFFEQGGVRVIYKRFASLYVLAAADKDEVYISVVDDRYWEREA